MVPLDFWSSMWEIPSPFFLNRRRACSTHVGMCTRARTQHHSFVPFPAKNSIRPARRNSTSILIHPKNKKWEVVGFLPEKYGAYSWYTHVGWCPKEMFLANWEAEESLSLTPSLAPRSRDAAQLQGWSRRRLWYSGSRSDSCLLLHFYELHDLHSDWVTLNHSIC